MTWLNGAPWQIRKLGPVFDSGRPRGTSILDDRILQFFGNKSAEGVWRTTVYIADLKLRIDNEPISFAKVAMVDWNPAWIQLLPSVDGGFVSAEWNQA